MPRGGTSLRDESIYNLIPEEYEAPERPSMYHSKHNAGQPPSYSTFPSQVSNAGRDGTAGLMFSRAAAPIGKVVGGEVNPKNFLKAGGGHTGKQMPEVKPFHYNAAAVPKDPVPTKDDKPVMGLVTEKNFVRSNAVEAVCSAAKKVPGEQSRAVDRPSFGRVPKYLGSVKTQVSAESGMYKMARDREEQYHQELKAHYVHAMAAEEKTALVATLRERWEEKHRQYQALPFAKDTAMSVARKEKVEKEMKEIEDALAKLDKQVVYVYKDENPQVANWAKSEALKEAQKTSLQK